MSLRHTYEHAMMAGDHSVRAEDILSTPALEQLEPAPGWMLPSQALTRWQPRAALHAKTEVRGERGRYGFRIGSLGLMVQPDTLTEVITMTAIFAIPNGPSCLLGVINLRSHLVPIFDMATMCGLARTGQAKQWILVLDRGERAVGLIVAEYPKRLHEPRRVSQLPSLPSALQRAVSAGYLANDELWLEFDHRAFFSAFSASDIDGRL